MSTATEESGITYKIKCISFFQRRVPILLQNENGPCPLLAIANILLLRNQISIPIEKSSITQEEIITMVVGCLLDTNTDDKIKSLTAEDAANIHKNLEDAMSLVPNLASGIDVNPKFTDISSFEFTNNIALFDLLNIRLVHGWLVDLEDVVTANALGVHSYNEVVNNIVLVLGPQSSFCGADQDLHEVLKTEESLSRNGKSEDFNLKTLENSHGSDVENWISHPCTPPVKDDTSILEQEAKDLEAGILASLRDQGPGEIPGEELKVNINNTKTNTDKHTIPIIADKHGSGLETEVAFTYVQKQQLAKVEMDEIATSFKNSKDVPVQPNDLLEVDFTTATIEGGCDTNTKERDKILLLDETADVHSKEKNNIIHNLSSDISELSIDTNTLMRNNVQGDLANRSHDFAPDNNSSDQFTQKYGQPVVKALDNECEVGPSGVLNDNSDKYCEFVKIAELDDSIIQKGKVPLHVMQQHEALKAKVLDGETNIGTVNLKTALVQQNFLEQTSSQLTEHGLAQLHKDIVWEQLSDVHGDNMLATSEFVKYDPHVATTTEQLVLGKNVDSDLKMAMMIQEEENLRHQMYLKSLNAQKSPQTVVASKNRSSFEGTSDSDSKINKNFVDTGSKPNFFKKILKKFTD